MTPDPLEPLREMIEKWTPEQLAEKFHETYERLAPSFGYSTRKASRVPWREVPTDNRNLMIAVCGEMLKPLAAALPALEEAMAAQDACIEAMQEPMACGHFAVNLQPFDSGHEICIVCAERDAARGEKC